MKKIIFLLTAFSICLLTNCEKARKLTQFRMDYHETVVVGATQGINLPFNILTPEIESNAESTFSLNDTRKDLVKEIILDHVALTIISPEERTFSFLKSINIFLNADGLPEEKIAWRDNINSNNQRIELETTGKDLKDYIKKDTFVLRLNTVTKEHITRDYHIDIHSVFMVDAKLL